MLLYDSRASTVVAEIIRRTVVVLVAHGPRYQIDTLLTSPTAIEFNRSTVLFLVREHDSSVGTFLDGGSLFSIGSRYSGVPKQ
jgi:hypothetical protein